MINHVLNIIKNNNCKVINCEINDEIEFDIELCNLNDFEYITKYSQIIFIEQYIFSIDTFIDINDSKYNVIDFSKYKFYENQIAKMKILIPINNLKIIFEVYESWFEELVNLVQEVDQTNSNNNKITHELIRSNSLKIAEKIAADNEYIKFRTRENLLTKLINKYLSELDINEDHIREYIVKNYSEKIFFEKYEEKQGKKLNEEIMALKNNGKTKKEIISILNITEGIYDRYSISK